MARKKSKYQKSVMRKKLGKHEVERVPGWDTRETKFFGKTAKGTGATGYPLKERDKAAIRKHAGKYTNKYAKRGK